MDGSTILKETDGTYTITYYYGNSGVVGFCYKAADGTETDYFFEKNLQGDVIALCNSNGSRLVEYVYDAWGKLLTMKDSAGNVISNNTSHIGYINPIRYRSYYYDVETKLYYLESRYYDPETGRFLNADSLSYLGEGNDLQNYNLYSYCENNPVMYADPSGHSIMSSLLIFAGVSLLSWAAGELFGQQLVGGIGSVVGGSTAVTTGISMFSFGPLGVAIGVVGIVVGIASIAFGAAEIQEYYTGHNWIQNITDWSDDLYNGLYMGVNIIASLATIGGNLYRSYMTTSGLSQVAKTPQRPYSRYYQVNDFGEIKSVTQFNRMGLPKYRIDVLGRAHNGLLPHKHLFSWNALGQFTGDDVSGINWWIWKLLGNWR